MKTSEVLNLAADHIQEYGHHKGSGFGSSHSFTAPACAHGALSVAGFRLGNIDGADPARRALSQHLGGPILFWNDAPERSASEVIEVLRACALIEAAREEQDAAWATYADVVSA